jgi:hypothetical protein
VAEIESSGLYIYIYIYNCDRLCLGECFSGRGSEASPPADAGSQPMVAAPSANVVAFCFGGDFDAVWELGAILAVLTVSLTLS